MAVEFSGDTVKRSGALYVDFPENIRIEPDLNGRHEHTEIEDLAADIEKNGQMSPVGIRKDDDGAPVLVYGHRRYRAISLLNERNPDNSRKIVCNYFAVSEVEAFAMAIGENRFRRDVSPIDDCANIVMMMKRFGKTYEDCAKVYFPEARTDEERKTALQFVKDRAALVELSSEAANAVRDGRVKLTAAKALAKLSKNQQNEKLKNGGKVKGSDVTPPKAPKAAPVIAKPAEPARVVERDAELRKLVWDLINDATDGLADAEMKYLEIDRNVVIALRDYMEE